MAYVSAQSRSKKSTDVLFTDESGRVFVRQGGSRAWRNNNPGNLRKSQFASEQGAIGEAGGFAVFATQEAGRLALKALLQTETYGKLTIEEAVKRYAPPSENGTAAYTKNLIKLTGLDVKTKLASLTDQEIDAVVKAIQTLEGTIPGTEQPLAKVVSVVTEHGRIVAYQLDDGSGPVGRAQAVAMARAGQIDAVVVAGRSGAFLRTRPDNVVSNNLEAYAHAA